MEKKNWFSEWFNTPYYHILYKHRNDDDAQLFMSNITQFLKLPKTHHILDLPCGKGRHSVYLNSLGYKVTGGDLSENSIAYAKQFENEQLSFNVHDMREPFRKTYDAVFNLFTSFGYFEKDEEDILILKNIKAGLKKDGYFVFDFLNAKKVVENLVERETKTIDDITFKIQREVKNGFILKHILFKADSKDYNFTERVKFIDLAKMKDYLEKTNFTVMHCFGNYRLDNYDESTSDRLILVAK